MTVARPPAAPARLHAPVVRLEVAWTASARALDSALGYASAALRLEVEWEPAGGTASVRATLDRSGHVVGVPLPTRAEARIVRRGPWVHVEVRDAAGRVTILVATFRDGRLAYAVSEAPRAAGLPGGSYDAPTGILELYDAS